MKRSAALLLTWILLSAFPALAQLRPEGSCVLSSEEPQLRAEGRAELVGDIIVHCNGGDPTRVFFVDFTLSLDTNITSDLTDPADGESEALLLIDDPQAETPNLSNGMAYFGHVLGAPEIAPGFGGGPGEPGSGNVYVGRRESSNAIRFAGVPYVPPGPLGSRRFRVVNVRADANALAPAVSAHGAQPIRAWLRAPVLNIPFPGDQIPVGIIAPSLAVSAAREEDYFELSFGELFSSAFRKRLENTVDGPLSIRQQGVPGTHHLTESGFTPDFGLLELSSPGVADSGTRLVAMFQGLPPGVFLAAPGSVRSQIGDQQPGSLEARRITGFDTDYSGGEFLGAGAKFDLIPIENGKGALVYEVLAEAPYDGVNGGADRESFRIPVQVVFAQQTLLRDSAVTLSYGPWDPTSVMSGPAPEPRFSDTLPTNLFTIDQRPSTVRQVVFGWHISEPVPIIRTRLYGDLDPIQSDTVAVLSQTGGDWLTAAPQGNDTTDTIIYSADPSGLAVGTYHAAVTFREQSASETLHIVPVLLEVKPAPELFVVGDQSVTFEMVEGGPAPKAQTLLVNARYRYSGFDVTIGPTTGGNWLSVNPLSGSTPEYVSFTADPTGLGPGTYQGVVMIEPDNDVSAVLEVPVTFIIRRRMPIISTGGAVNAASYVDGGVSPGEMVTFFGSLLGPTVPAGPVVVAGRLPTVLAGVRILFDEIPAPVFSVWESQSTCIVPYSVAGKAVVTVVFEYDGVRSDPVQLAVKAAKPGIFTLNQTGAGQAVAINQDGTINSPANPADRGTVIAIYLTGAGQTMPAGDAGALNSYAVPPLVAQPVGVRIGGLDSEVTWSGGTPGAAAGIIQMNARIGANVVPGAAVGIEARIGGVASQPGVTISVR